MEARCDNVEYIVEVIMDLYVYIISVVFRVELSVFDENRGGISPRFFVCLIERRFPAMLV